MILRNKLVFAVAGAVFFVLAVGLSISIGLYIQEKRAVKLREFEKFMQDEGGDKNGVSLEYQEEEDRKLLALQKEVLGNGNQDVADTLARLTEIILAEKNLPEAESLARESIAAYKNTSDPGQFQGNGILVTLSKILWRENKMAEAEALARENIEYQKKATPDPMLTDKMDDYGPPVSLNAGLGLLAGILWDEGKSAEAQAVYDEAFRVRSAFVKARQIQAQKPQPDNEKRAADTNQPTRSPIQNSEQYLFRQTNVVQTIPGWGGLIDPEGGCAVKSADGTLAISVPEAIHPIGQLVAYDVIDGITTNSVFYTGREVQVLQEVKGDFTVQVKVSWKLEQKLKTLHMDDAFFFRAGLLLLDGTNNIHFYSSLAWGSVDCSAESEAFEDAVVCLNYNLSSYRTEYYTPYKSQFDYSMGFKGKFSYLRMSRSNGVSWQVENAHF